LPLKQAFILAAHALSTSAREEQNGAGGQELVRGHGVSPHRRKIQAL